MLPDGVSLANYNLPSNLAFAKDKVKVRNHKDDSDQKQQNPSHVASSAERKLKNGLRRSFMSVACRCSHYKFFKRTQFDRDN